ncbi:MAG: hypothetical protein JST22_14575 [Bacteroidetes bacterium]|nr:hypothetical protein [Bacteroidota bacterium]
MMATIGFSYSRVRARRFLFWAVIAVCMLAVQAAPAQRAVPPLDQATGGTRYIIAFPDTIATSLDSRYPNTRVQGETSVWIYSEKKNDVSIVEYQSGSRTDLTLQPGEMKHVVLAPGTVVAEMNRVVHRPVYNVASRFPVVLYCFIATIQGMEAWTPAPLEQWGMRYYAAAVPGEVVNDVLPTGGPHQIDHLQRESGGEILIIGSRNGTHVSIIPPAAASLAGSPSYSVVLNEGEVYQVTSLVDTSAEAGGQSDLAATLIESDKPVGVVSGNRRARVLPEPTGILNNVYGNLLAEWVPPVRMHGTEFVFLPTWDMLRPGQGGKPERSREFVRFYNTSGAGTSSNYYVVPGGVAHVPFSTRTDTLSELALGMPAAVYFRSSLPAMAMMHSSCVVGFEGTTPCADGIPCVTYTGWAPYMAELIPRERWGSFAPFFIPASPGGMQGIVSVVADSADARRIYRDDGSPFPFTRSIVGTRLVWGTDTAPAPGGHWIEGRNGARFTGIVYGSMPGSEQFRPQSSGKAQYEEYNALSYGYPLVPRFTWTGPPDSMRIDISGCRCCREMSVSIVEFNANPGGLASITLDPATLNNAQLVMMNPALSEDIPGSTSALVKIVVVDPSKPAHADLVIRAHTGKTIALPPYDYSGQDIATTPARGLDFGTVKQGSTAAKIFTLTNMLNDSLVVTGMTLYHGATSGFTPPAIQFPFILNPGASYDLSVGFQANGAGGSAVDTLSIQSPCGDLLLPLEARLTTAAGVAAEGDAEFGCSIAGGGSPHLDLRLSERTEVAAELYDLLGNRLRILASGIMEPGERSIAIDRAGLAGGIYYCLVVTHSGRRVLRVVMRGDE